MEITALNLTVDHETPIAQQTWRDHLIVISSTPTRFVGLVKEPPKPGEHVVLYAAASYIGNLQLQAHPNGGVKVLMLPQDIVPYDLMAMIPEVTISKYEHYFEVKKMVPAMAEWFYSNYLEVIAGPSKIVAATPPEASKILAPR